MQPKGKNNEKNNPSQREEQIWKLCENSNIIFDAFAVPQNVDSKLYARTRSLQSLVHVHKHNICALEWA